MSDILVHIEKFRMDFGDESVIRDLSFDVQRGETFGFLGSNGSGKTTTIRALLGIYQPTAGTLHIGGRPFRPEDGDRLGYLPEERGLYKKEKVLDIMTYFGRLKGIDDTPPNTGPSPIWSGSGWPRRHTPSWTSSPAGSSRKSSSG
jgi:ABC-2 type transport system ATP-binding protein